MSSEQTVYPSADLAGDHQLETPLPVDGTLYKEPVVASSVPAAYQGGDAGASKTVAGMFSLPDVAGLFNRIGRAGTPTEVPYQNIPRTVWTATYPDNIQAGQLLELFTYTQEPVAPVNLDRGIPNVNEGFELRWTHNAGTSYSPRVCKFFKIATGTETGTVTIDFGGLQSRLDPVMINWEGVDPNQPYDVQEISAFEYQNPDPPSIVTATDNALVQAIVGGDWTGGDAPVFPAGYSPVVDQVTPIRNRYNRAFMIGTKTKASKGFENPGAWTWDASNSTIITDVLRPAGGKATVAIVAGVTDDTASAQLGAGDAPTIGSANEVHTITADPSGKFNTEFNPVTGQLADWYLDAGGDPGASATVDAIEATLVAGGSVQADHYARVGVNIPAVNSGLSLGGSWRIEGTITLPSGFYGLVEDYMRFVVTDNYLVANPNGSNTWRVMLAYFAGNLELNSEYEGGSNQQYLWTGAAATYLADGQTHTFAIAFKPGKSGTGSWALEIDDAIVAQGVDVTTVPPEVSDQEMAISGLVAGIDTAVDQDTNVLTMYVSRMALREAFSLTFSGSSTAGLAYDAIADQVLDALEIIPAIGAGNIQVTGGPLGTAGIAVEYIGAGLDNPPLLVHDGGSAVDIVESVVGAAQSAFTYKGKVNVARQNGAYSPQAHLWILETDNYLPGQSVDVTVSSQGGALKSYTGVLLVLENVAATNPILDTATEDTGTGMIATFGALTPSEAGSKALALVMKALGTGGGYYSGDGPASTPTGFDSIDSAVADSMSMSVAVSPPLPTNQISPSPVTWEASEKWVTDILELVPEVPASAGGSLASVINSPSESSWIEVAPVAGNLAEVFELDLTTIPPNAVIVGAEVEFAHKSGVRSPIRVAMVGINPDGSFVMAPEDSNGYIPEPLGTTQQQSTSQRFEFDDGSTINLYDRLGVMLMSRVAVPGLSSHKVFWIRSRIFYEEGGPVVSGVVGPTDPGDPVRWSFSSAGSFIQTGHEIRVIAGAGQDPDAASEPSDPLAPAIGELVYASGFVPDADSRQSVLSDVPFISSVSTVAVRGYARLPSGLEVVSDWATADFTLAGSAPSASGVSTAFNEATGTVDVSATAGTGAARAWVETREVGQTDWTVSEVSPVDVAEGSVLIQDDRALFQANLEYRVAFDKGPVTPSSAPASAAAAISTINRRWYLMVPGSPDLNSILDVAKVFKRVPRSSTLTEQPGAAVAATSAALGSRWSLTVRLKSKAERATFIEALDAKQTMRLVDIFGDSWLVRQVDDTVETYIQVAPTDTETTRLRDFREMAVELVEVFPEKLRASSTTPTATPTDLVFESGSFTGDGGTTIFSLAHNLDTSHPSFISVVETSTGAYAPALGPAVTIVDPDTVSVEFGSAPANGAAYSWKVVA